MVILRMRSSSEAKDLLKKVKKMSKYSEELEDILEECIEEEDDDADYREDDEEMTVYIWPIVREMIKTAIENKQNLIVEGCYIPFDWRKDFDDEYLKDIKFICLAMTEEYIDAHFEEIRNHASDIESRIDDSGCSLDWIKEENKRFLEGFKKTGEIVEIIDSNYEKVTNAQL